MDLIFIFILFIIWLLYTILIFSYALFFNKSSININGFKYYKVSIIIPARNEELNILLLLESIKNQSYLSGYIEIIVVDDASTDNTVFKVKEFADQNPDLNLKLLLISENTHLKTFKKYAISKAIEVATGHLIITTDADCVVNSNWIIEIVKAYNYSNAKMLVGLVAYKNDTNCFGKMQHLEFLSLIASGTSSIHMGFPIMCNGANLIYEKQAFIDIGGFSSNDKFASGDDIFLLLKIKKYFGKKSVFALNIKETIVYTEATKTIKDFTNQRLRWASKTKGYKDISILFVAGIVFLFNFSIIISLIYGLFNSDFFFYGLIIFTTKLFIDFPLILKICRFMNRKDLLKYYLPMQFIYLPYIMIIGVLSNFISYKWKGRVISK